MNEIDTPSVLQVPYVPELTKQSDTDSILALLDLRGCRQSIEQVNWAEQYPYKPLAMFTIAHSGEALYIDFFVRCNYLKAENYEPQSPVSKDSCVEFFVEPHPDEPHPEYWNFEFNCIGAINASHRVQRPNPTRLDAEQLSSIVTVPSCGTRPFKELEGLFTWNLLVRIPLSLIGVEYHQGCPVKMRGNFYKCASATSLPHYLSWRPIHTPTPDFHRPEYFGEITLF